MEEVGDTAPEHPRQTTGEDGGGSGGSGVLLAFGSFGLATLLVGGLGGAGMWLAARMMGVDDVAEFSTRMRSALSGLPRVVDQLNPLPRIPTMRGGRDEDEDELVERGLRGLWEDVKREDAAAAAAAAAADHDSYSENQGESGVEREPLAQERLG